MKTLQIAACGLALSGLTTLCSAAGVTGQWEFNGNFSAAIGTDIQPQGSAVADSAFGTTTSFGIPNIAGQVAQVLRFPGFATSADGYKLFPGAAANGTTADVNRYSLVMDVFYPASSAAWRSLWQTSASNSNDGDWFVNPDNGLGISSQYSGNLTADAWHRIALVIDLEQADPNQRYQSYIDGSLVGYVTSSSLTPGGRWAAYTAESGEPSWIFSDENADTALGYVNSVQFRDYPMTASEISALGGATAGGIAVVPEPGSMLLGGLGVLLASWRLRRKA